MLKPDSVKSLGNHGLKASSFSSEVQFLMQ